MSGFSELTSGVFKEEEKIIIAPRNCLRSKMFWGYVKARKIKSVLQLGHLEIVSARERDRNWQFRQ